MTQIPESPEVVSMGDGPDPFNEAMALLQRLTSAVLAFEGMEETPDEIGLAARVFDAAIDARVFLNAQMWWDA